MGRFDLTDEQYDLIKPFLPIERTGKLGRPWTPHRPAIDGMFWILRTGAPWRDLPERYGRWQTVYWRFSRWRAEGRFERILRALCDDARARGLLDFDFGALDGTVVRAHKAAAGAGKKKKRR
jgi:transposase